MVGRFSSEGLRICSKSYKWVEELMAMGDDSECSLLFCIGRGEVLPFILCLQFCNSSLDSSVVLVVAFSVDGYFVDNS